MAVSFVDMRPAPDQALDTALPGSRLASVRERGQFGLPT
jgi:hypothetical protein